MDKKNLLGLEIWGKSIGGVESCFILPQYKIAFDIGKSPRELDRAQWVFLTHCHVDHAGSFIHFLASRQGKKSTIFCPAACQADLEIIINAWQRLDGQKFSYSLQPLQVGDKVRVGKNLYIQAIETCHRVPSLGYVLWQRKSKLRKEFQGLQGREIAALRARGVQVTEVVETPIFAYTGDTTASALDKNPVLYQAQICAIDCTFWAPDHVDLAHNHGHIHVQDIAQRADRFQNQHLILCHISPRYQRQQVISLAQQVLPARLMDRVILWM